MSYAIFSKSMSWIWDMDNVLVTSLLIHILLPHHVCFPFLSLQPGERGFLPVSFPPNLGSCSMNSAISDNKPIWSCRKHCEHPRLAYSQFSCDCTSASLCLSCHSCNYGYLAASRTTVVLYWICNLLIWNSGTWFVVCGSVFSKCSNYFPQQLCPFQSLFWHAASFVSNWSVRRLT
jgi:hypothetical protein